MSNNNWLIYPKLIQFPFLLLQFLQVLLISTMLYGVGYNNQDQMYDVTPELLASRFQHFRTLAFFFCGEQSHVQMSILCLWFYYSISIVLYCSMPTLYFWFCHFSLGLAVRCPRSVTSMGYWKGMNEPVKHFSIT